MGPSRTGRVSRLAWLVLPPAALAGLIGCGSREPAAQQGSDQAGQSPTRPAAGEQAVIKLTSTAFAHGQPIPRKCTFHGDDASPPLSWSGVPEGTKGLALICEDPDAPDPDNPRPPPWVHWVVYNIPATAEGLPEGIAREARPKQPAGIVQGNNSWPAGENVGYRGPKPPIGKHRYFFTLYALDAELDLKPGLDKNGLLAVIDGHILARGELMGTYER